MPSSVLSRGWRKRAVSPALKVMAEDLDGTFKRNHILDCDFVPGTKMRCVIWATSYLEPIGPLLGIAYVARVAAAAGSNPGSAAYEASS
jgi:hypothetical protein